MNSKTNTRRQSKKSERRPGTSRASTAIHQPGSFRVFYTNADGRKTARGERTRFATKRAAQSESNRRNKARSPREQGRWGVEKVGRTRKTAR